MPLDDQSTESLPLGLGLLTIGMLVIESQSWASGDEGLEEFKEEYNRNPASLLGS